MRARRCPGCGDRFYHNPAEPKNTCQNCAGEYDPTKQAQEDAANIARVNDFRVLGNRKQTVDLKTLQDAQKAASGDDVAEPNQVAAPAPRGKNAKS